MKETSNPNLPNTPEILTAKGVKWRWRVMVLVLLGLSALICIQRLHTYHEPLERDLTTYAVIGHELLGGRSLYSDLCENKPPGIFITFAVAEKLVGYGPGAIYLLGVIAAIVTLFGVYVAGFALSGKIETGLWAALFWTVICSDLQLEANQPNTEVFANGCLILAFSLIIRTKNRDPWLWRYFAIGALLAIASFYKTVVIAIAVTVAGAHIAFPPGDFPDRRLAIKQIAVVAVIGMIAWVSLFAYFAAVGHLREFYEVVFTYNSYYSGNIIRNLMKGLRVYSIPGFLKFGVPLIYLTCLWALLILQKGQRRPWVLLLGLAIGTQITVALPGRFYPHYYLYWVPSLAFTLAWAIEECGGLAKRYSLWVKRLAGIAVLIILVGHELPNYMVSPEDWSKRKYGPIFVKSKQVGEEIARLLRPGETFYEWGAESGLYFYSRYSPPSGVIFYWHLVGWPFGSHLSNRVIKDLEKTQPELFIIQDLNWKTIYPNSVLDWFRNQYRPFALMRPFILFARRGGKLEARQFATIDAQSQTEAINHGSRIFTRLKVEYLTIKPQGEGIKINKNEMIEEVHNIKVMGNKYLPLDNKPLFILKGHPNVNGLIIDDKHPYLDHKPQVILSFPKNIKGLSWKSTTKGGYQIYYLFEGEEYYSNKYSDIIQNPDGNALINIEIIEKVFGKKLKTLRVDPMDGIELFELTDFIVYQ